MNAMQKIRNKSIFVTVGLGFGDEGKGTTVDCLTRKFDVGLIVRYGSGFQAAHNVALPDGRHHTFSGFGSGTFVPKTKTLLSKYVLIEPFALENEEKHLREIGVSDAFQRLYVDERAVITTPFHIISNRLNSQTLAHGTCGMGVGATMEDSINHPERIIRVADIFSENLENKLKATRNFFSNSLNTTKDFDIPISLIAEKYRELGSKFNVLTESKVKSLVQSENIIFEGAQGILLDEDYGFHPHTTWSHTTKRNALQILYNCGIEENPITVGITRTYGTRHGNGVFPTCDSVLTKTFVESHNDSKGFAGNFRCGWLDLPLLKYAVKANQGIDYLALTHLDKLNQFDKWKVCVSYNSSILETLPCSLDEQGAITNYLSSAEPQYSNYSAKDITQVVGNELDKEIILISHGMTWKDKIFYG